MCIPLVCSTGHGHARINNIHYYDGKFESASIVAVLMLRSCIEDLLVVEYVYSYLLTHKDDVLVPYMKGSANVSLNIARLGKIKIPFPDVEIRSKIVNDIFDKQNEIFRLQNSLKSAVDELEITKNKIRRIL